jgi:hypothetical protein
MEWQLAERFPNSLALPIMRWKITNHLLTADIEISKPFSQRAFMKAVDNSKGFPLFLRESGEPLGRFRIVKAAGNLYQILGTMPGVQRSLGSSQPHSFLHLFYEVQKRKKDENGRELITEARVQGACLSANVVVNDELLLADAAIDAVASHRGSRVGIVYFIKPRFSSTVKIGTTKRLSTRLNALQTAASEPLDLLATIPGSSELERRLHEIFDQYRLNGEWFSCGPGLQTFLRRLGANSRISAA